MHPVKIAPRYGQRVTLLGLSGVTVGVLVLGLVLPYLIGSRPQIVSAGTLPVSPPTVVTSDAAASSLGTDELPPSADGADTAPTASPGAPAPAQVGPIPTTTAPDSAAPPATVSTVPATELRSTDRGVSAEEITIGFILGNYGGSDPQDAIDDIEQWTEFFNTKGGVLGRRFHAAFGTFDSLDPAGTSRAACIEVTENEESFMVFDRGAFREPLCVTEEHQALFVGGQFETESYVRSQGRLITFAMDTQRLLRNQAELLHRDRTLEGKTIGVVYDARTFSKLAVERGLIPQLEARGYSVEATSELSGTDLAQAQSQIPIEVAKHQGAGVDFIFMVPSVLFFSTWTQEANTTGYRPLYAVSDISGLSNADFFPGWAPGVRMIGHSSLVGQHEFNAGQVYPLLAGVYAECEALYEEMTGTTLYRPEAGAGQGAVDDYTAAIGVCPELVWFRTVGEAVGPELTTAAFSAQVQTMTNLDYFARLPGSSFGPGKLDSPNHMRRIVWQEPCPHDPGGSKVACMVPDGPFGEVPYPASTGS